MASTIACGLRPTRSGGWARATFRRLSSVPSGDGTPADARSWERTAAALRQRSRVASRGAGLRSSATPGLRMWSFAVSTTACQAEAYFGSPLFVPRLQAGGADSVRPESTTGSRSQRIGCMDVTVPDAELLAPCSFHASTSVGARRRRPVASLARPTDPAARTRYRPRVRCGICTE